MALPLWRCSAVAAALLTVTAAPTASADEETYDWRKEPGKEHGSQVASSEWLPIMIGAAGGVMVGGLVGAGFDDSQPPIAGPIVGGVLGGVTGGAAGAWLIRSMREKDTRLAGTVTGLGLGGGLGVLLFAKMDPDGRALETVGKYGALALLPVIGAVAGHHVAAHFMAPRRKDAPPTAAPTPVSFAPTVTPVADHRGAATGMTFGIDATFF